MLHQSATPVPGNGILLLAELSPAAAAVLTPGCVQLIADLERAYRGRRQDLLALRERRQARLDAGATPDFLPETASVRQAHWTVRPAPVDLRDRRVEITGPADRKMIVSALNSGAQVFMADFEDSLAPTWSALVQGQLALRDAVRREIDFTHPETGKRYELCANPATLVVRPRGWHLDEKHLLIDDVPVSAGIFDAAVYLFHNAEELLARGSGPYLYLPKLESHLEARLWNDVLVDAQRYLGLAEGSVRVTVLIETLPAVFEMDEILYELREHVTGLNCGRWDYVFSYLKTFRASADHVLPDRDTVGMDRPFLTAYSRLLIATCHRRGAHAMGGMAALIPVKDDPAANAKALDEVRVDKRREALAGHDGTWVAHPGLVDVARREFDRVLFGENQIEVLPEVNVEAADLLEVPTGTITEAGLRKNLTVALRYLVAWIGGRGCVPLDHRMEDAATAEISRAQVWHWRHHRAALDDGRIVDDDLVRRILVQECDALRKSVGDVAWTRNRYELAADLLRHHVLAETLAPFVTNDAYEAL
jgi:malate synthase